MNAHNNQHPSMLGEFSSHSEVASDAAYYSYLESVSDRTGAIYDEGLASDFFAAGLSVSEAVAELEAIHAEHNA